MEKKQYELCINILKRFHKAGILESLILIGSWCLYFYRDYFADLPFIDQTVIKTRDIDFLVGNPARISKEVDIANLLEDLGFIVDFKGSKGYIKLDHPDLIVEFLVPESGRGINKPYNIKKLGINATPLRFLDLLSRGVIKVKVEDFYVTVPHPANFALHKLIIFQRRAKKEKATKDSDTAIEVLKALFAKGESRVVRNVFNSMPRKWQAKVVSGLEKSGEEGILSEIM